MKLKHFALIFSSVGIFILYLLSLFSQPINVNLNEISEYEGKEITTEGLVTAYYTTRYGSQLITIEENNGSATVFIEGEIDVEYGDRIRATGEVQKYKNSWEIIANDERDVKIIQKWHNISFPLWQLAENPAKYRNLNVNVTGYVETLTKTSFCLVDLKEKHSLTVFYNSLEKHEQYTGKKVSVAGKFYFDEKNFEYVLEIYGESHGVTIISEV